MITWVIQISLISIIFIFLVHHLFCYLKNILTIPKVKDLVTLPSKKYENILSIISNQTINNNAILKEINNDININNDNDTNNISYTEIDLLPNSINSKLNINELNNDLMKDELKSFFKSQLNDNDKNHENDTNIDFFNNYSKEENYSYL